MAGLHSMGGRCVSHPLSWCNCIMPLWLLTSLFCSACPCSLIKFVLFSLCIMHYGWTEYASPTREQSVDLSKWRINLGRELLCVYVCVTLTRIVRTLIKHSICLHKGFWEHWLWRLKVRMLTTLVQAHSQLQHFFWHRIIVKGTSDKLTFIAL